ncbi:MAG: DUF2256 domain-containing protein [Actinobacteria bacterium]|nr:DUF2256 domain-containing protein [Actinomycetota bacterium]
MSLEHSPCEHCHVPSTPRHAQTKNGFPPRICERCGRPYEWRRRWARDWEQVRYCSERCKRA